MHNRQVTRVPHLHAMNVHPSKTLVYKNMIYISKRHKNYICKQKNYIGGDLPISPHSSPGGTSIARSLEKSILAYGQSSIARICRDSQEKNLSLKASMVLPPPCRGSNAAHLHTAGKVARCPHTVSRGLKHGTLSKKNEHRMVPNPKFLCVCCLQVFN